MRRIVLVLSVGVFLAALILDTGAVLRVGWFYAWAFARAHPWWVAAALAGVPAWAAWRRWGPRPAKRGRKRRRAGGKRAGAKQGSAKRPARPRSPAPPAPPAPDGDASPPSPSEGGGVKPPLRKRAKPPRRTARPRAPVDADRG